MAYNKWVGTVIGGLAGGYIGAIFGFALGSMADSLSEKDRQVGKGDYDEFTMSLLVLAAAVMKADGIVMRSELLYVKQFLQRQFGETKASKLIAVLRKILDQDIPVVQVSHQIRSHMNYSGRLQLIHFLWGIAGADGKYPASELAIIEQIAGLLGISRADRDSVKAMYIGDEDAAYKILDIHKDATDDEMKKAYRKMALKYHPDKVEHLGDDVKKAATEKFKEINAAWETIKGQRGIK